MPMQQDHVIHEGADAETKMATRLGLRIDSRTRPRCFSSEGKERKVHRAYASENILDEWLGQGTR